MLGLLELAVVLGNVLARLGCGLTGSDGLLGLDGVLLLGKLALAVVQLGDGSLGLAVGGMGLRVLGGGFADRADARCLRGAEGDPMLMGIRLAPWVCVGTGCGSAGRPFPGVPVGACVALRRLRVHPSRGR